MDAEPAREICERLQTPVSAPLRAGQRRTAAQVREAEIRTAVHAERRKRSDARRRRMAEVCAQIEARRAHQR